MLYSLQSRRYQEQKPCWQIQKLTRTLVGRLARLKSMKQNMINLGNELSNYKGSVSTSPTMAQVTETGFDMDDLMATIEWDIKEKTPAKKPDKNKSISIVKTVPSLFPKFDGDKVNFDIWKKQWKALADNSGLKNNGILIKLREHGRCSKGLHWRIWHD
ncbi:unnamed protein product [Meganyctiphanes norvegica]|uniref:Uncharacterized protein n=1 Tax=Meganyctiphanes norvegica TaxID=48144 RepID=A0AAV2SVN9_MEGNR